MLFQYLVVSLVVLTIVMVVGRPRKLMRLHRLIKVDFPYIPIIGHAYKFIGTNEDRMTVFDELGRQARSNKYGATSFWFANQLTVSLTDPMSINIVLKTFADKWPLTLIARHLAGNGSIFAEEKIWRLRRKILAPMFSSKYYTNFVEVFDRNSRSAIEGLGAVEGKGDFSIWEHLSACAIDSALELTFGEHVNAKKQLNHPFVTAFHDYFKHSSVRICQPWLYSPATYYLLPIATIQSRNKKIILELIERLILKRKNAFVKEQLGVTAKRKQDKSLLELLIEFSGGEHGYTDIELREETVVLVLAAADTSATAAYFSTVLLAQHPAVQERIYEETREHCGERSVSVDDLVQLKYLDAVAKESLRLYPPIPVTVRKCANDIKLPSGLVLREGCLALLNLWGFHRNPQFWGADSEEFNPDRFVKATPEQLSSFMPFGYGPRNCVGMKLATASLKLYLAELTRRYRIAPGAGQGSGRQPLRVSFNVTLKHSDDFKLQLTKRC